MGDFEWVFSGSKPRRALCNAYHTLNKQEVDETASVSGNLVVLRFRYAPRFLLAMIASLLSDDPDVCIATVADDATQPFEKHFFYKLQVCMVKDEGGAEPARVLARCKAATKRALERALGDVGHIEDAVNAADI